MSVGTVFDRFGLFVSYEFAETMREVRTIVHEKRTLRGEEGLEEGNVLGCVRRSRGGKEGKNRGL